MDFEQLYRGAWADYANSWLMNNVQFKVRINNCHIDNSDYIGTRVSVNGGPYFLVHQCSTHTESEDDVWCYAIRELLKYGAAKMYESIVQLIRNKNYYKRETDVRFYPLHPNDVYKKNQV